MLYLALALYAEGPTDYQFLSPLLARLAEDLCTRLAVELIDVGRATRRKKPSELFRLCGESVRLERLRLLPAFQRLEADLLQALRELRFAP